MKIIIEVMGGMVTGVFGLRQMSTNFVPEPVPEVSVIDLDCIQIGEPLMEFLVDVQPIGDACEETQELLGL